MSRIPRDIAGTKADAVPAVPRSRHQIIQETIEEAMRPYLGVLPPQGLKSMRDALEDALTTHPVALEALDELEGRPAPDRSGTRVRGAGAPDEDDAPEDGSEPSGKDGAA